MVKIGKMFGSQILWSAQRKPKTEAGPLDLIVGYQRFLKLDVGAHLKFF